MNNGWGKCEGRDSFLPMMDSLDVTTPIILLLLVFINEWQSHGYSPVVITEVLAPTLMLILTTEECCHNVGAQDTLRAPSPDLLRVLIPESRLQLDINGDINA